MNNRLNVAVFSLFQFILIECNAFAIISKNDSLKITQFTKALVNVSANDTLLENIHNQIPYKQNNQFAGLGSIVLPQRNLYFNLNDNFGLRLNDNVYQLFEYNADRQSFFNVLKPVTDLGFGVGSKKESYFSFFHTQNFGQRLNVGSALRTARTLAFYKNQNPHFVNFSAFISYSSKNKRYFVLANTVINRLFHKENGGVVAPTLYTIDGNRQNSEIVRTNLANANSKVFRNTVFLRQYYNLNPSTDTVNREFNLSNFGSKRFYHEFNFSENWMRFSDSSENYLTNSFRFDSLKVHEYLYHQKIENSFGFQQLLNHEKSASVGFDLGLKHSYNYISQPEQRSNFNNVWLYANVNFKVLKQYNLSANYTQAISGYNMGDFQFQTKLFASKKVFSQWFDVGVKASTQLSEPTFVQQNYWNSKFKWDNNFKKISISQIGFFAQADKTTLELNYNQLINYVYFDEKLLPTQSNTSTGLFQLNLLHPIKLNKLHINTSVLYQKTTRKNDVLRLPELLLTEQLYFEGYLFKKSLLSQVGIELNYTTSYYANAYAPLLNQFYLQNKTLAGAYPQLDVFFNFKIQQVRIFVKMCNVNYGLYPTFVYYQTPNNPMYNRLFRLGVIWRFWE